MKINLFCALFSFIILSLTGCGGIGTNIQPSHVPLGYSDMTLFSPAKPVTLINANDDKIVKVTGDNTSYDTNLRDWSHQAILMIRQWLTRNGAPVVENADKIIKISVVKAEILPGWRLNRMYLQLMVETGDGTTKIYPAEADARGFDRSAGYAINWAVVRLIQDGTVVQYITK